MLQRWGKKNTERLMRENGGDETVWDVVILDNGSRADVIGSRKIQFAEYPRDGVDTESQHAASFMSPGNDDEVFDAVQRRPSIMDELEESHSALSPDNPHQISDDDIRSYIMKQLPQGSHATIRSDLVTARTITVDVYDDDNAEIAAPPGTKVIEERHHHDQGHASTYASDTPRIPKHTVVFRTAFNRSQSADVTPHVESIGGKPRPSSTSRYISGVGAPQRKVPPAPANHRTLTSEQSPTSKDGDHHVASPRTVSSEAHSKTKDASLALHRQTRGNAAPTLSGEPETASKYTFGRGSLTRFAHRVKPTDRTENTRWPLRMPSKRSSSPATNAVQPDARRRPSNKPLPQTPSVGATSVGLPDKVRRQPPAPAANRGVPRSPLQDSSQNPRVWSTPSPTAAHNHAPYGNSKNNIHSGHEKGVSDISDLSPHKRHRQRGNSSMSLTRSGAGIAASINCDSRPGSSTFHTRSESYSSSIYSLATAGSETSLVLAHRPRKSAYEDTQTIQALNRDGHVPGIFPENHFVQNIRRFCRFSLASYGTNALKVMGVPKPIQALPTQESDSHEHSAFSDHTGLPPSTILLSSFFDPAGGSNAVGETETGFPLVHYLCIDHDSKAIVLTLRGTWGFEDILTDMTCDYDDLEWQSRSWKVHKGMHASARRLLEGGSGRVMVTIRAALEEFTDYGVILCGHSLGGGVAALLATMISEPNGKAFGTSFVTAPSATHHPLITAKGGEDAKPEYFLPPGRPIHVYTYGPPAVMSPSLRRATRGLITTVVNGQDVVPSLSLGILNDMHSMSLAFKSDASGAKSHVRNRVWEGLRQSIINKFYVNETPILVHAGDGVGEDAWAWKALKMLREEMRASKLMPPGEVFVVDAMRVLQRDAFTPNTNEDARLGRPATRVQLKFIRDAEALFGELRFGSGMLSDHNPVRYEATLAALARGILDE